MVGIKVAPKSHFFYLYPYVLVETACYQTVIVHFWRKEVKNGLWNGADW